MPNSRSLGVKRLMKPNALTGTAEMIRLRQSAFPSDHDLFLTSSSLFPSTSASQYHAQSIAQPSHAAHLHPGNRLK